MHLIIGLFILIGIATFVVFAFWQGMGVPRSGRSVMVRPRAGVLIADLVTQPMGALVTVCRHSEFACLAIERWSL